MFDTLMHQIFGNILTRFSILKFRKLNYFRPYTAANGMKSNVWFDRKDVTPEVPEHTDSMEEMCKEVTKMIDIEVESGIPRHRVILGTIFSLLV